MLGFPYIGAQYRLQYNRILILGTPSCWCTPMNLHKIQSSISFSMFASIWVFPKIRGTFLGVPIIRIVIYLGLYWGPLILGNYHLSIHYLENMETLSPKPCRGFGKGAG